VVWGHALLALVVALFLQIGTNYANDYSDGVKGTDADRVGPLRLVGSGLVPARQVRAAAWTAFGVAGLAGLMLAAETNEWLVVVGAAAVAAGWLYTGGPKPYGYLGLGEAFVFVFFGLVATVGTIYVTVGTFPAAGILAGVAVGLLATALLEANNLRDIAGDTEAGKKTLAVRLGRDRAGWLYVGSLVGVVLAVLLLTGIWDRWAAVALLAAPLARRPVDLARSESEGRDLLPMLATTARVQLVAGGLLTAAFVLGGAIR
jgi:1,4-dihydroxy-2-naphthoate octaprenyltransferase